MTLAEYVEYAAFRFVRFAVQGLSFRQAGSLGGTLGSLVFRLTRFRKKTTLENISGAFPLMTATEQSLLARRAFVNYGTTMTEMVWAGSQSPEELMRVVHLVNREVFDEVHSAGKGVILLSGHFGGWEMILNGLCLHLDKPFLTIVQRQRNGRIDELIDRQRRRFGNATVPMGPAVREVMSVLGQGGVVAMLGDQSGPKEALFVDFFGRPAATHRGAAAFSLKTGAGIVMVFLVRRKDGMYDAHFEPVPQDDLGGYSEENVNELTRRHTAILERYIRRFPDQWLWMHRRWKHGSPHRSEEAAGRVTGGGR